MAEFDEEGIRKRFLYKYYQLKKKYNFTDPEFGIQIGAENPEYIITKLANSIKKISLEILMRTHSVYPEIDLIYVQFSKELPEVETVKISGQRNPRKRPERTTPKRKYTRKAKLTGHAPEGQ